MLILPEKTADLKLSLLDSSHDVSDLRCACAMNEKTSRVLLRTNCDLVKP